MARVNHFVDLAMLGHPVGTFVPDSVVLWRVMLRYAGHSNNGERFRGVYTHVR